MRVIINITEERSVVYALKVLENLKNNSELRATAFVYRGPIKEKLLKLDENNLIERIITQSDIGLFDDDALTESDILKIKNIENNYTRKTIWNYVYQDRTLIYSKRGFLYNKGTKLTRNTLIKTILKRFEFVEHFFLDFKPDLVLYISEDFGTSISTVLYEVANRENTHIIIPIVSKFKGYASFNDDIYGPFSELEKRFNKNSNDNSYEINEETKLEYEKYISDGDVAFYIVKNKQKRKNVFLRKIKSIFTFGSYVLSNTLKKEKEILYPKFWSYTLDKLTLKYRFLQTNRLIKFSKIDEIMDVKYVYFPLHYEPELVLLVQSQDYLDQLNTIQNISRNLPSNVQLVVKDHPIMVGRRKPEFYKTILGIPNIVLVDAKENSIDIIKASLGIITIIGSAGMEGFFHNKPVITLSDAFFNFLPSVKKINSFNEITQAVLDFSYYTSDLNAQLLLVQTIKEISIDFSLRELIKKMDQGTINKTDTEKLNKYLEFLQENISKKIGHNV
jgi:hypothetical protein